MIVTIQCNQNEVRKSLDHATFTLKEVDIPPKKTRRMQAIRLLGPWTWKDHHANKASTPAQHFI